jgi:N-acetylmuramoyl-L-alanine amidase
VPTLESAGATLLGIARTDLGNVVRITLELDSEIGYREERLGRPPRVFFDLHGVALGPGLSEQPINFRDAVLPQIRVGRRPEGATRVAMDLEGVARHTVFTLYNPYRLVIDFERGTPAAAASTTATTGSGRTPASTTPLTSSTPRAVMNEAPAAPAANASGGFSLSRQLGLGVSRIVIDPGHGGHDPGAKANRITEAELVLDVALRLEKLLLSEPGIEVVMTRRTDVFVPLEQRTAIANREQADLFLSIHANASRNTAAHGVETYYLNFASSREAELVAARENSASGRTMHHLPDILKAIALNDKIDESRDFAEHVQRAMTHRLKPANRNLRNLGVKRAPFVVLIGARMPSVLAEISFITNRQEATLLRTPAYRQRIAEALFDAVTQYQRSLKGVTAVAEASHP